MKYQGTDYLIESSGDRTRVRIDLANLTREQAWVLLRLRDLFADPDKARLLHRWLEGRSFLRYDPDCGLIRHVPVIPTPMPLAN